MLEERERLGNASARMRATPNFTSAGVGRVGVTISCSSASPRRSRA
jgi:hypothetical protein